MVSIFRKELNLFFSSLTGYISITIFLVAIGLFIWVFPETNVMDFGYATLDSLFIIGPWMFMFLIPAITMRSFSEERRSTTFEILATKPISDLNIIFGKYLASLSLVIFSLLPTLIYFYTIYHLGDPAGNIDTGATWGSYLGLLFVGGIFISIGIFSSSVTDNQIVAFISAIFLCFFFYIGFDYLSGLPIFYGKTDNIIKMIGINDHYTSISRGVIDTRDIIYFLTIKAAFTMATKLSLESRKW